MAGHDTDLRFFLNILVFKHVYSRLFDRLSEIHHTMQSLLNGGKVIHSVVLIWGVYAIDRTPNVISRSH